MSWEEVRRQIQPRLDWHAARQQAQDATWLPPEAAWPLVNKINKIVVDFLTSTGPYEAQLLARYGGVNSIPLAVGSARVEVVSAPAVRLRWYFSGLSICDVIDVGLWRDGRIGWAFVQHDDMSRVIFSADPDNANLIRLHAAQPNVNYAGILQQQMVALLIDAGIPLPS